MSRAAYTPTLMDLISRMPATERDRGDVLILEKTKPPQVVGVTRHHVTGHAAGFRV